MSTSYTSYIVYVIYIFVFGLEPVATAF